MMTRLGRELHAALLEVLDDVKGIKRLPTRTIEFEDIDVPSIRAKYKLTQREFAQTFGFSLRTLQQWEQKRRRPHGSALVLLQVIDYAPEVVYKALRHKI